MQRSSRPRATPAPTTSSPRCRRPTTRIWASGAQGCRAASASACPGLWARTRAVAEGGGLSGPALAELAHAMAGDAQDGAWRLVAATGPLLERGDDGPLRALAATGDEQAARLLADLGLGGSKPLRAA